MNSEGEIQQCDSALAALATAIDTLLAEDLTGFTDTAFAARIQGLEACRRRLETVGHRHVIEINDRQLWTTTGSVGLYRYLVETLRLAKADAVARVKGAAQLGVMTSAYGEKCEPRLPATAAALAAGVISGDHARAVMRVMDRIPDAVDTEHRAVAEEHLADAARAGTPEIVGKVGDRILGYLDPDGTLTTAKDRARLRAATFGEQRLDGMSPFQGCFDPELRAMVDTIFAKWARPGMCMPDDPDSPQLGVHDPDGFDPNRLAAAVGRDVRTPAQRRHDALTAFLSASGPDNLGAHRGLPVSIVLTMSVTDLLRGAGVARAASGTTIPVREAWRMAQGSIPLLLLFDETQGKPLYLGEGARIASSWQRLAAIARDRGCTHPDCSAPATMCAMHHLIPWAANGPTDIDNLTLVCDAHHAQITADPEDPSGWATHRVPAGGVDAGRTAFCPPVSVDPRRRPRVNRFHHPEQVLAVSVNRRRARLLADRTSVSRRRESYPACEPHGRESLHREPGGGRELGHGEPGGSRELGHREPGGSHEYGHREPGGSHEYGHREPGGSHESQHHRSRHGHESRYHESGHDREARHPREPQRARE
ncbi:MULTISPECIES: HNH endonuclease signature motif containing protein [unclassified Nocardia]|uniref:HNH endonuclease signature motif containing protein n=2 Tax=Nocardia TaxID=1817 RepID=UPI00278BB789|nr:MULTISPECIES: HNH endonuclease signature motif containing protein [unclassified Nocardia]